MLEDTPGIHHVTGIVGDAQSNLDFYAGVLGLRLVKRTVNHEDVLRYHLYYGNGDAALGSLLTAFPYPGDPPGRLGKPGIAAVAFVVPPTRSATGPTGWRPTASTSAVRNGGSTSGSSGSRTPTGPASNS
ncbi:MAG: VOC family protein [Haloarculaceae archaeon]